MLSSTISLWILFPEDDTEVVETHVEVDANDDDDDVVIDKMSVCVAREGVRELFSESLNKYTTTVLNELRN